MPYVRAVIAARRLLAQRHLAALICAAALLLRLLVPAGYMIDGSHGHVRITICPGAAPKAMAMAMPMPGMDHARPGPGREDHGRADMPCAFSGLSAPSLGAIDPVLLVALIAFIMATGLIGTVPPAPAGPACLRPPPRGPPPPSD